MKIHRPRTEWRQWLCVCLPSSNVVAKISPTGRTLTWESANATYKGFFSPSESLAVKQFPANNWVDMDQSSRRAKIIAADVSKTHAACSPILGYLCPPTFILAKSLVMNTSNSYQMEVSQCTDPQWYVTPWMFKKIWSWDFSREEVVYK